MIDPVKRTQHDDWIDKQDKDAISGISKAVEEKISAFGNEIKNLEENAENKISDIGDGLKNLVKNASDKIDLEDISESAHKKVSDIEESVKNFAKNAGDKINFESIGENAKKKFDGVKEKLKPNFEQNQQNSFLNNNNKINTNDQNSFNQYPYYTLIFLLSVAPFLYFTAPTLLPNKIISAIQAPNSLLNLITKVNYSNYKDYQEFVDVGGLSKNTEWHGLYIENIQTRYNKADNKLTRVVLNTRSKATWLSYVKEWGVGDVVSPKEIRDILSEVCNASNYQWKISDDPIAGFVETNDLSCIYDYQFNNRNGFSIEIKSKK